MIGIDEAGRGSLAGGFYIVGVKVLDKSIIENCSLIRDSKKLSKKQRNKVYDYLQKNKNFLDVKIYKYSAEQIDKYGLSLLYKHSLTKLKDYFNFKYKGEKIIFDGNTNYGVSGINVAVRGEEKYKEIAIASIIAKVLRDKEIEKYKNLYPEYLWEKHNGYPQNIHKEKIKELGYIKGVHRKSWKI